MTPKLIKDKQLDQNQLSSKPLISQGTRNDLDTILQGAVEHASGKRARINGYKVTGKTGTSNILENGKYNED